jgi:RNA 2',3'-cyclic 3'-phosphodiesterase
VTHRAQTEPTPAPLRLFLGAAADAACRHGIHALQQASPDSSPAPAWVAEDDLHLTLRFLGSTERSLLPALRELIATVAATHPATRLDSGSLQRWSRLLVLGYRATPALERIVAALEGGIREHGLPAEQRPYRPHLTLARRYPATSEPTAAQQAAASAVELPVDHIALYQSAAAPGGTRYTIIARHALG